MKFLLLVNNNKILMLICQIIKITAYLLHHLHVKNLLTQKIVGNSVSMDTLLLTFPTVGTVI